ncbi:hypothetical protein [Ottowia thiooxydans]|uniref:hypothetical protein n=1 Tax=Ottowia thiooxydans TaxID=219182 RepID=UPI000423097B|nr:hypothetical protein [Ottowia thiooxydans]
MTTTFFMGVSITLDSFERNELPGVWWPHASLVVAPGSKTLENVSHDEHYASRAEADGMALRIAKRRIRDEMHQG